MEPVKLHSMSALVAIVHKYLTCRIPVLSVHIIIYIEYNSLWQCDSISYLTQLYYHYTKNFHTDYRDFLTQTGRGGAPLHPMYFECTGNEERLSQCESRIATEQIYSHEELYCELGMYAAHIYSIYHCDRPEKTLSVPWLSQYTFINSIVTMSKMT